MAGANEKLLKARLERGLSQADVCTGVGVDIRTYKHWEHGETIPQPYYRKKLSEFFDLSLNDLGYDLATLLRNKDTSSQTNDYLDHHQYSDEKTSAKSHGQVMHEGNESRAISNSIITLNEEQIATILAFFRLGEDNMVHFDPERRAALLEALGIVSTVALAPLPNLWDNISGITTKTTYISPEALEEFDHLVTISWKLLRGNDLAAVEYLLPKFFPKMVQLVQQPSNLQQRLAALVAHGYNIQSLISGHRDDLRARLAESKKSEQYSQLAHNRDLEVTALIAQAVTYDYNKHHHKSLQVYQRAEQLIQAGTSLDAVSPLSMARVYAGLAGSYARCGQQEKQAKKYLELAHMTMPDEPELDPSFYYADVGRFTLLLWGGRMYLELDPEEAWNVFSQFEQLSDVPLRNRTEFLNHMVEASIASGDMEKSVTTLEAAVKAANTLNSERRKRETRELYATMRTVWRHEQRVKGMTDLLYSS
jgi:transcriptional regulator with XRE-family HTH domain